MQHRHVFIIYSIFTKILKMSSKYIDISIYIFSKTYIYFLKKLTKKDLFKAFFCFILLICDYECVSLLLAMLMESFHCYLSNVKQGQMMFASIVSGQMKRTLCVCDIVLRNIKFNNFNYCNFICKNIIK